MDDRGGGDRFGGGRGGGGRFDNHRGGGGGLDGDSATSWRRGSGFSSSSGGGGFDNREQASRGGGGLGSGFGTSGGERPRLNLARRSDLGSGVVVADDGAVAIGSAQQQQQQQSTKSKSNPFGSATAVDTASKFAAIELKERREVKDSSNNGWKKENQLESEPVSHEHEQVKEETNEEEEEEDIALKNEVVGDAEEEPECGIADDEEEEDYDDDEVQHPYENEADDDTKERRRERGSRGGRTKLLEPKVVNSRAAMLDAAAAPRKEVSKNILNMIVICALLLIPSMLCVFHLDDTEPYLLP